MARSWGRAEMVSCPEQGETQVPGLGLSPCELSLLQGQPCPNSEKNKNKNKNKNKKKQLSFKAFFFLPWTAFWLLPPKVHFCLPIFRVSRFQVFYLNQLSKTLSVLALQSHRVSSHHWFPPRHVLGIQTQVESAHGTTLPC